MHEQCAPSPSSTHPTSQWNTPSVSYSVIFYLGSCVCVCVLVFMGVSMVPQTATGQLQRESERVDCSGSSSPIRHAANVFFCHIRSDAAGLGETPLKSRETACFSTLSNFNTLRMSISGCQVIQTPTFTSHEQFRCMPTWWDGQSRSRFQQLEQPELFPHFISDCFGTCRGQTNELYLQEHVTKAVVCLEIKVLPLYPFSSGLRKSDKPIFFFLVHAHILCGQDSSCHFDSLGGPAPW